MSEEMNLVDSHEFKEGDLVKATIAQVDEKSAIVTIEGAPFDGIVPISELSSLHIEKASDAVSIGEELELMITKVEEANFVLSKRKVDAEKAWDQLEKQFQSGEVIETEVKEVVKGGLVVDLGVRGFIPASLIEDHFVESFEDYKGKVLTFKIVELEKEKNRLILSHKAVVEDEKAVSKQKTLENIHSGDIISGTVQLIQFEWGISLPRMYTAAIEAAEVDGNILAQKLVEKGINGFSHANCGGRKEWCNLKKPSIVSWKKI